MGAMPPECTKSPPYVSGPIGHPASKSVSTGTKATSVIIHNKLLYIGLEDPNNTSIIDLTTTL